MYQMFMDPVSMPPNFQPGKTKVSDMNFSAKNLLFFYFATAKQEFKEIIELVGMTSKPLHVKRLRKAIDEYKKGLLSL